MVQLGYDSDEETNGLEQVQQKYTFRKAVTPYVCSTPCDLDEERRYISKEIFPKLAELCHLRCTEFSPFDIPWQSNSLQTEEGHLLRMNLEYIGKCAPFFLCLLGETYGPYRALDSPKLPESLHSMPDDISWIDKNYMIAASAGYKWIKKEVHGNCSITELEILQAVFLGESHRCHFYYRQPEHLDDKLAGVSEEEKCRLVDLHKPKDEYADLNIRDLKQRIVNKGLHVKYFRTCEQLGEQIMADWVAIIDELYPPLLGGPSLYDKEEYRDWLSNEVFSESRRKVFVSYPELRSVQQEMTSFCDDVNDYSCLDMEDEFNSHRFMSQSASSAMRKQHDVTVKFPSVLVMHSDRGMGKSTLVVNWVRHFSAENPDVKVISHFIGSSGHSRDATMFMQKCVKALREENLPDECDGIVDVDTVKQNFKELSGSFQASLSLGPCVLVLDGVDELGGSRELSPQEIKSFSWIPLPLPPQCRIVITTLTSDISCVNLGKRPDVKFIALTNFSNTKIKAEFLEDHMHVHYDHLKRCHLQTIFESKLSGKPLFLRLIANEMCSLSVYTELDKYTETIREMCTSIRDLFVRCFKRWSHDYSWTYEVLSAEQTESEEADFIGWVPDVLRLLAVSRSGLKAHEILDILVAMGYQENVMVTPFDWYMFLKSVGDNLTESPFGMFTISHQHMREVVEYVLLRTVKPSTAELISVSDVGKDWKKQKILFHQHLVKYFRALPPGQRRAEELPWQLLMACDMQGLKEELTDPDTFERLYDAGGHNPSSHSDLARSWYYLEREGMSAADAYTHLLVQIGVLEKPCDEPENQSMDDEILSVSSEEMMSLSSPDGKGSITPPTIMLYTSSSPSVPTIFTTPASDAHKLSVIDEASDISKDDRSILDDNGSMNDQVFMTQETQDQEEKFDLSPAQTTMLTWHIAQFLLELGHKLAGETILLELNTRLMKAYPLTDRDQLVHAQLQEHLGQLYLEKGDLDLAEKWYRKALRSTMDMFEAEETEELRRDIQTLKCKIIKQIGFLRLQEGMLDDADDLLQEALDLSEVIRNIPLQATVNFHVGNLRNKQNDYLMAETNLRKSLLLRQRWFGRSHPLVADTLFSLGKLTADENNDKGFDRSTAGNAFRRCLQIREQHLEKDHVLIAEVLFELGKLLKFDTHYSGRAECQSVLRRALDIRITQLGGDHIETRAVRSYLNSLEVSLKSAKHDIRSAERPFSSLTWRSHDLANIERKSRLQSGKSSSYGLFSRPGSQLSRTGSHFSRGLSQNLFRPVSGQVDHGDGIHSQRISMTSFLSASERIMMETNKPRLLHRETVDRKLKQNFETQQTENTPEEPVANSDARKQIHVNMDVANIDEPQVPGSGQLLDSFGVENEKSGVKFRSSQVSAHSHSDERFGAETPPQRLFKRYGSPQNQAGDAMVVRVGDTPLRTLDSSFVPRKESSIRTRRPAGSARSARSVGSSLYTSCSGASIASHRSNCDIPKGPFSIHISNSRTITQGPHSSVRSLLGDTGPKDISKGIHHKSAWYHVPGRYSTSDKKHPPKRSQIRKEAQELEKSIPPVAEHPHATFMKSDYRKNNPNMLYKGYPSKSVHTCGRQTFGPYPRQDTKQYTLCDKCRQEAVDIITAKEEELLQLVNSEMDAEGPLAPKISGLTAPDRPRQVGYVLEEPIIPDDYGHAPTVTFKEEVLIN